MKLEFIELAGFRGFRDRIRFDLPPGFVVVNGRNGAGKSTLLDAVDFALTGTISKFAVKSARGGGLDRHIWWVGPGKADQHYVSVGFVEQSGERFVVTHDREKGPNADPAAIISRLCGGADSSVSSTATQAPIAVDTLVQTSLIRDELIAGLSLDLPERARAEAVRAAIGGIAGPDYSERTEAIFDAAIAGFKAQQERFEGFQSELGRALTAVTEARSAVEQSTDLAAALEFVRSRTGPLPSVPTERLEAIRRFIAANRTILETIKAAISRSEKLAPNLQEVNSTTAAAEMAAAQSAVDDAVRKKAQADSELGGVLQLDTRERAIDTFTRHLAAIIDHGDALGLQEGHCPLCNAVRSEAEFKDAIAAAKDFLATRGGRHSGSVEIMAKAQASAHEAAQELSRTRGRLAELVERREEVQRALDDIRQIYSRHGFDAPADKPAIAQNVLLKRQDDLSRVEAALFTLEASSAIDRVTELEGRVTEIRDKVDLEAAKLATSEKAAEAARQINATAKAVVNQIVTEQFDTVMPLFKELYRRLRPHLEWTDIEADFGGQVRASLNFVVGGRYNPQFLFSSGQRRAAGLAFLLAVHLSRPWCRWQTLLLDDPVQHIDDYRALNLVEVLSAIRRTGRQVILAVEDPALADVLGRRLRSADNEIGCRFDLQISVTGATEIAQRTDIHPMKREVLRPAQAS